MILMDPSMTAAVGVFLSGLGALIWALRRQP
jgi:hypothetical protein